MSADDRYEGEPQSKRAAASHDGERQDPPQDGTDSTTWDTDQHSDAPGPFGTG